MSHFTHGKCCNLRNALAVKKLCIVDKIEHEKLCNSKRVRASVSSFVACLKELLRTNSFVLPLLANPAMAPLSFFLFVGGLVLLVLAFALYVFPYVVCPAIPQDGHADPKDPIRGFCLVFR
jgi:hypothetical protein